MPFNVLNIKLFLYVLDIKQLLKYKLYESKLYTTYIYIYIYDKNSLFFNSCPEHNKLSVHSETRKYSFILFKFTLQKGSATLIFGALGV